MKFVEKYDSARPYIASYGIFLKGDKIAMIVRKNTGWRDGYYCLPTGKVDPGEPSKYTMKREAKEEVGVDVELEDIKHAVTLHRHTPQDGGYIDWVDIYFLIEKWSGELFNAEEHKSEKVEWVDLNNLPEKTIPEVRRALELFIEGEVYGEYGWE